VVTILIPNFNKGAYVKRAIRSVQHQTLQDFEVVFSDDKSTDLPFSVLVPLIQSDERIRFWVNQKHIGTNQNRANCVCAARGIWLLSLDSDDEFMNRTAEIAVKTQQRTGADMMAFRALQIDYQGRYSVYYPCDIPCNEADNNTLVAIFKTLGRGWTLWNKFLARSIYQKTLLLMGYEICTARIDRLQDRLHFLIMIRFVHKYIHIHYFGYLYHRDVWNNSARRTPNWKPLLTLVNRYIAQTARRQLPNYFDIPAMGQLCAAIAQ
jgi:glycosyltransferase involved in cell wall biosynthesis